MTMILERNDAAADVATYPHGMLGRYNDVELKQIAALRKAGRILKDTETTFWVELVRTKLMLDAEDGRRQTGGRGNAGPSRFTEAVRAGDLGDEVLARLGGDAPLKNGTLARWLTVAKAASELLSFASPVGEAKLPPADAVLVAVNEHDISRDTLEMYGKTKGAARELCELTLQHQGQLRADFIKEINKVVNDYPGLIEDVREGIKTKTVKVPSDLRVMMEAARIAKAEAEAAAKALQEAQEQAAADAVVTLPAETLQAAADQQREVEVQVQISRSTPPPADSDVLRPFTTYPVLECIDPAHQTPVYNELRAQFKKDSDEFLADMRTAYKAVRDLRDITKKWAARLQNDHAKQAQHQMLLWETWSVCWDRLGNFKKLGNVHHVTELMNLLDKIINEAKHSITVAKIYCKFDTKKWREFVVAETADDHWQPGRKQPINGAGK